MSMEHMESLTMVASDLIVTATEGGINYWGRVTHRVEGKTPLPNGEKPFVCFTVAPEDEEFPDLPNRLTLTSGGIVAAIARIGYSEDPEFLRRQGSLKRECKLLLRDGIEPDFDADAADIIVQVALFGDIIYG